jgi:circadian clock protein KaiB
MGDSRTHVVLKLYIAGETPRSHEAVDNLRKLCDEQVADWDVEVIDVLERPQLAEDEKILATPALVKELPPPMRRIIGNLADTDRVLIGLDLKSELADASGHHPESTDVHAEESTT